jgi:hypothetical protein
MPGKLWLQAISITAGLNMLLPAGSDVGQPFVSVALWQGFFFEVKIFVAAMLRILPDFASFC